MSSKSPLVPKLRFPDFRGTGGWAIPKLGSIGFFTGGGTPSKDKTDYWIGVNPWVSSSDVFEDGIHDISISRYISDEAVQATATKVVPANSILLVSRVGVGKLAISRTPICTSQDFTNFTPAKDNLVFLAYCIKSLKAKLLAFNQGMAIKGFTKDDVSNLGIPLPKLAEQQKIADCLSSLDELIAAQARKVDALKTHKKGLMQQLFPREGETQPRLRFPEFRDAGAWQKFPLSSFVLSLDAGVSVNSGDSRPANKTEFGVLKTSAITKGQFEPEENKVVLAESELSRLREPVSGDTIIICRKNTPALVGANAYVESNHENLFLPDLLWAAKPRERAYMRFLAFILGSEKGRAALSKLAKGSSASMSNISKADVLAFPVMAPAAAEQQRIVDCLTALDTLITSATQALETLKAHKKGLMQQLFPSAEAVEA